MKLGKETARFMAGDIEVVMWGTLKGQGGSGGGGGGGKIFPLGDATLKQLRHIKEAMENKQHGVAYNLVLELLGER